MNRAARATPGGPQQARPRMIDNHVVATPGGAQPTDPPATDRRAPVGLRERKKRRTRQAILREAMRLFLTQGYEATTIEQIADAVDISPSTFFNYFPSKEDVVFADENDPVFVERFLARPAEEALGVALRRSIVEVLGHALERDRDVMLARGRLSLRVPDLRARAWAELERGQDLLRAIMAQRTGRDPDDFGIRVTAMALAGALYAALMEWVRNDGRDDVIQLVNQALDIVESGASLTSPA